jgi:hypothetical protein
MTAMQIIQTKLKEHRIQLMENEVTKEQVLVDNAWNITLEKIKSPIRYVVVGEATTSFDNYIYNTDSQKTSFLFPSMFGCKDKAEMLQLFENNGILVFDLYPFPLPTFVYDLLKIGSLKGMEHHLTPHFNKLKDAINEETQIVVRYKKLTERPEWALFEKTLGTKSYRCIGGSNQSANSAEIKAIFGSLSYI